MWSSRFCVLGSFLIPLVAALQYSPDQVGFNLNENETATDPLDYWGEWPNHDYHASPSNWRMPMYTLMVDRFVNGDPTNDNANGTQFEHDILSNQLRFGGDVQGLQDTLDYLQGTGVKTLYLAGTPMINMPWGSDGYSPLDLTLLDRHLGDIKAWRGLIADIHQRGMYVVFDNTFATLGDLIAFEGYLNTSTPFAAGEHNVVWKSERRYQDFEQSDAELPECTYPRFWGDDGHRVTNTSHLLVGCRDSDFDQYGEVASFGDYTEWQRQLSKFAFVQDRLREWRPSVLSKIQHFSCMMIASLDIDGFRIDKAVQVTVDAQGAWSSYIRQCARTYGKDNFYIPGEIVTGNSFGAIYIGRGMEPEMQVSNITEAVTTTNATNRAYIREPENSALDGAAFHYTVYRALTRFLGMDGTYAAEGDPPVNFVETWNALLQTNDMVNSNTGKFDPRHMFGISNQDVFRWPAIQNGTEKNLLGLFIVTLLFPGIPTLSWGEEQAFYVLESTNANYVFGRAPMSSSRAWQIHGCYKVGSVKYSAFPTNAALYGCEDDNISLDHRDPSHPIRNIIKRMFEMREAYPVLNDGYYLQQLSNQTHDIYLPGSNHTPTETGLWSVYRSAFDGVQDFTGTGAGQQSVWLLYTNENSTVNHAFDCSQNGSLISPFSSGTTVKNLFAPYDEYTLEDGSVSLGLEGATGKSGCISKLTMAPWEFKALVPKDNFISPTPVITEFHPGHDYRVLSTIETGDTVHIKVGFSVEMDCDSILSNIKIDSTVTTGSVAIVDNATISCSSTGTGTARWVGQPTTAFTWEADLVDVHHGVHKISLSNVTSTQGNVTGTIDKFLLRVGEFDNPLVFPATANYSSTLLSQDAENNLIVTHKAPGADLWRYSLDFGTTYSNWTTYSGGGNALSPRVWTGTKKQAWKGQHVIVQYFSSMAGSSDHYQHADVDSGSETPRRFPNLFLEGPFNQYGFDAGIPNELKLDSNGYWTINHMAEWPAQVSLNAWGMNPDGLPDATQVYGDIDGDNILDRIPPQSLVVNVLNLTQPPPSPFLNYRLELDDGSFRYQLIPAGSRYVQLVIFFLLAIIPVLTAVAAVWIFMRTFYQVKFNKFGTTERKSLMPDFIANRKSKFQPLDDAPPMALAGDNPNRRTIGLSLPLTKSRISFTVSSRNTLTSSHTQRATLAQQSTTFGASIVSPGETKTVPRRVVLIATMEYDIEDWNIKIKIGGLGVMAQLMGKNLMHQDLIWVVPCVGGIDYPDDPDEIADPMEIVVLGQTYFISVRIHVLRNITYVLLDAPVFRQQTKSEPYPARMDDLESAIYYSAWNSCIAEAIRRFKPDLYHINDYHGTVAPLHLLPDTIPCALSLHNAEFQGLWPMRNAEERDEVCRVYDLDPVIVQKYVQFGEVFNLLHAAASYLRVHQKGFGAVGVSKKYGKRSYARYPIFWGLKEIGSLPNPDPSDTLEWHGNDAKALTNAKVDRKFEAGRAELRQQAQEWAGLNVDPSAELFVFVGRWSMQKGVDLIADLFPSILEQHPRTQLICVGPVIDLYGKFAAVKLDRLMKIYPGRVYSKPEFTALPPYIFSGAEFALIPSRDEPFGLVAVEFGRKGALGVGARVGGLGQMPGWWYTVESISTKHLLHQFKSAIETALATPTKVRAELRARSAKQRFPVAQWVQKLETLQLGAIKKHDKYSKRGQSYIGTKSHRTSLTRSGQSTPFGMNTPRGNATPSRVAKSRIESGAPSGSNKSTRAPSPVPMPLDAWALRENLNQLGAAQLLGTASGPGHGGSPRLDQNGESHLRDSQSSEEEEDDDDFYEQSNPALKSITFKAPSPAVEAYDDFFDDYFEQTNPALNLSEHLNTTESAYGADSLQATFQRSLVDSNDLYNLNLEPVAFKPILNDLHVPPVPRLRDLPMVPLTVEGKRPLLGTPPITPQSPDFPTRTSSPPISHDEREDPFDNVQPPTPSYARSVHSVQTLSLNAVRGDRSDLMLQKTDPFFTDVRSDYQRMFERKLAMLNAKNSSDTCIEEFIEKSEKDWFNRLRGLKMGKLDSDVGSTFQSVEKGPHKPIRSYVADSLVGLAARLGNEKYSRASSPGPRSVLTASESQPELSKFDEDPADQFLIQDDYEVPTGAKRLLLRQFGEWPLYSLLLAFGQIIAANSYQITLLTGEVGEAASKLYTIASIYLVTSIMWWGIYRSLKSIWVLSLPFLFYGLAFFFIGLAAITPSYDGKKWVQNFATAFYAIASSSGALFFALNFGDQGGAPVTSWVFRACVIQGTQQIYIAALWWWGSNLAQAAASGVASTSFVVSRPAVAVSIGWVVAVLMWTVGILLFKGLPNYYRQEPGAVPQFLRSVLRRKIVIWFFIMVIIQNFFLSAPYGRNWLYLWSSQHVPGWAIACLTLFFFVAVWAGVLYIFNILSKSHSWILPIFAIGLGAPRWCQMLWGVSGLGLYVPWAGGSAVGSAIAGRALWLWLGVLDAFQGVGFGMILLHTLTRFHISFTLIAAQVLGSVATICARGFAPDNIGPGPVFPNLGLGVAAGLQNAWFWIALLAQLAINVLAFMFFRKEQLSKP